MKGLISYALAIAGLGMLAGAIISTFVGNIKYVSARNLLINMLRTRPNQAEVLCSKPTGTFMDAIGAAIKACAAGGSNDLKIITATSLPTYDGAAIMVGLKFGKLLLKAKLGVMMVGGGFVLGVFGGDFSILLFFLTLIAVGGYVWLMFAKREAEASVVRARLEVLPEVNRAFVEGRYIKVPKAK